MAQHARAADEKRHSDRQQDRAAAVKRASLSRRVITITTNPATNLQVIVTRGSPQATHGPQVSRVAGMLTMKCATQKPQPLSSSAGVQRASAGRGRIR